MENNCNSEDNTRCEVRYPISEDFLFILKWLETDTAAVKEAYGKYVNLSLSGFSALTDCPVEEGNLIHLVRKGEPMEFDVKWVTKSEDRYRFGCQIVH